MNAETTKRLHDAIRACNEIEDSRRDWTRDMFLVTRGPQLIVWKLIEIVGEALRQGEETAPSLRNHIPELRDVVNTRNRITHGYDSVDFGLLWDIAIDEIPPLKERMAKILEDRNKPPIDPANGTLEA